LLLVLGETLAVAVVAVLEHLIQVLLELIQFQQLAFLLL
tara:strand:- start:336 stop:452 length:117 start_codon:yes stop_codon:yes gene_type:complete